MCQVINVDSFSGQSQGLPTSHHSFCGLYPTAWGCSGVWCQPLGESARVCEGQVLRPDHQLGAFELSKASSRDPTFPSPFPGL